MTREEFIKAKIAESCYTVKNFASKINMPYSTLLSILKGSIGGASVDNVIKICNGLDITINDLQSVGEQSADIVLSEKEKSVILAYRNNISMQSAVDKLLGIEGVRKTIADDIVDTISSAFEKNTVQK